MTLRPYIARLLGISQTTPPDTFPRIPVDTYGWVQLVRKPDNDAFIGETAVRSKGKSAPTNLTALLRRLMRKRHTSPFEFVDFIFDIYAPIDVARDWVRHRTANWSEMSGRATKLPQDFCIPSVWRTQSTFNKQATAEPIPDMLQEKARDEAAESWERSYDTYTSLLAKGVAYEQARKVLPVGGYTYWRWKIDLHNLLHFIQLRASGSDAMGEMQPYADAIAAIVAEHVPITYQAFLDYRRNAFTLSAPALYWLRTHLSGHPHLVYYQMSKSEWQELFTALQLSWDGEMASVTDELTGELLTLPLGISKLPEI